MLTVHVNAKYRLSIPLNHNSEVKMCSWGHRHHNSRAGATWLWGRGAILPDCGSTVRHDPLLCTRRPEWTSVV